MGLISTVLLGRPDGIRRSLLKRVLGDAAQQPRPASPPPPEPAERSLRLGIEPPKDVTPPEGFEVVLHRDALKPGQVSEVIVAGRALCVANVDGTFHAVASTCPHAGGPLGEGQLTGTTVTCPYHGWQFDVTTGACLTAPDSPVRRHEVAVVGAAVCVVP